DSWLSATPASGHLEPNGNAALKITVDGTALTVGMYRTKAVVVRQATATTAQFAQEINIAVQVTVAPASLTIAAGDGASGPAGSAVPLAVMVRDAAGNPLANTSVSFR